MAAASERSAWTRTTSIRTTRHATRCWATARKPTATGWTSQRWWSSTSSIARTTIAASIWPTISSNGPSTIRTKSSRSTTIASNSIRIASSSSTSSKRIWRRWPWTPTDCRIARITTQPTRKLPISWTRCDASAWHRISSTRCGPLWMCTRRLSLDTGWACGFWLGGTSGVRLSTRFCCSFCRTMVCVGSRSI